MKALPILEIHENDSFKQMLQRLWQQAIRIINGRIAFGDGTNQENIDGQWVTYVSNAVANTDDTITHNLGRIPVGYLVMTKSKAGDVYTGTIAWTATQMTLKCSVASVTAKLFIL